MSATAAKRKPRPKKIKPLIVNTGRLKDGRSIYPEPANSRWKPVRAGPNVPPLSPGRLPASEAIAWTAWLVSVLRGMLLAPLLM